jgi:hypothetical protein
MTNTNTTEIGNATSGGKLDFLTSGRRSALADAMMIVADAQWECDDEESFRTCVRVFKALERTWDAELDSQCRWDTVTAVASRYAACRA